MTIDTRRPRNLMAALSTVVAVTLLALPVSAAGTGGGGGGGTGGPMPWEGPLNQLLDSLTGPVARVIGAVAIIALGIGLAFSEGGSVMRKALWVVMGLAVAFNALNWGLPLMGFGGAVLI